MSVGQNAEAAPEGWLQLRTEDGWFHAVHRNRAMRGYAPSKEALGDLLGPAWDPAVRRAFNELSEWHADGDRLPLDTFIHDLADLRASVYERGRDRALANVADVARRLPAAGSLGAQLSTRAAALNRDYPQPCELAEAIHDLSDITVPVPFARYYSWVSTKTILSTPDQVWGDFGQRRPERAEYFAEQLAARMSDGDPGAWLDKVSLVSPVLLHAVRSRIGTLYELAGDGSHRVHTARMLGLDWIFAEIHVEAPRRVAAWSLPPDEADAVIARWKGLIARGLLRGAVDDGELTLTRQSPAAWWLAPLDAAAQWNAAQDRYAPGHLAPDAEDVDAGQWEAWAAAGAPAHADPPPVPDAAPPRWRWHERFRFRFRR